MFNNSATLGHTEQILKTAFLSEALGKHSAATQFNAQINTVLG